MVDRLMVACKRSQPTPTRQRLDTQLLLWLAVTPARLPPALRSDLCDRRRAFLYSVVSLWEVAIKTSLGTPGFQVDAGQLRSGLRQQGLEDVAITADHCLAVQHLPWIHREP